MPYLLPPSLTDTIESPFVVWENLFDEEEYKLIDKITKDLPIQEATTVSYTHLTLPTICRV